MNYKDSIKILYLSRLIIWCFFTLGSVCSFGQLTYSPISVTGFNMDVVAEGKGSSAIAVTSNSMDLSNNIVCTKQFATANNFTPSNTYGLPDNGTIKTGSRTYQIAPYTGNEVLNVYTASTQTLKLSTPASYTNISLAGLATENAAKMTVVFNFSDGTNQTFSNQSIPDWFFNSTTPASVLATNGFGRLGRTASPFTYNSASTGLPNLYAFDYTLPCTKTLISISISNVTTATASTVFRIFIFAVSGAVTNVIEPIVSNDTVCPGTSVTFNIQNPDANQNYIWYDAPYNGTFLGVGSSYSPPPANSSIIYYVQTINNSTGCPGSVLTPDSIIVSSPPAPSITSPVIDCKGQPFTLLINNSQSTLTYNWFSDSAGSNQIGTGDSIVFPNIITPTTYYVQSNGSSNCASLITPVIVNPASPVTPIMGKQNVCVGKSINLSDTTAGGVWSSIDSNVKISITGVVTGVTAGKATVNYIINSSGSCPDTATYVISVNALPVIGNITKDSSVCVSKTVTLYDTTLGGIWESTNSLIANINSNGLVSGVSAGVDTIRYLATNSYGCTDSVFIQFNVKTQATVAPIFGNNTLCAGKIITLSESSSGGIWYSDSTTIASVDQNGVVTGLSKGSDFIWYKVIIPGGCGDSAKYSINVNALPVIGPIVGDSVLCAGKTTLLTDTTATGNWLSTKTNITTIDAKGNVKAVGLGLDTIRYIVTNTIGCTDSVYISFNVKAQPVTTPITGPTSVCAGKNITLSESANGGIWYGSSSSAASVVNGLVTGITAGTDTIWYKIIIPGGCSDSAFYNITVNAPPVVNAIAGNNNICVGKTTVLNNATAGGQWFSTNSNIATVNGGIVTAISAGLDSIRYIVSNAGGCSDSVSFPISINPSPIVSPVTGNNIICVGKTTNIADATTNGVWVNENPAIATLNNSNGVLSGLSAGLDTIKYIVTNLNGCKDSVYFATTVNSLPIILPITGNNAVCVGKSISLIETTTGGTWENSNPTIATLNSGVNLTGNLPGSDIVRYIVTNINGCTDSVSLLVTVNALPVISAIAGIDSVCAGKTLLQYNSTTGGLWESTNTAVAVIDNTGTITGITGGQTSIRYIVTNVNGCTDSVAKNITVIAPSIASISGINSICIGNNTTVIDTSFGGVWSSTNPSIASISSTGFISGVKAGTTNIVYTVNNAIGCTNQVLLPFKVNALPVIPPILGGNSVCLGKNLLLTDATSVAGIWTSSNPSVAPVNFGAITGKSVGSTIINYTVTDANGCIDSTQLLLTVKENPISNFTLPVNICLPNGIGQFINTSSIPSAAQSVKYFWSFDDPNNIASSTAVNPAHQFKIPIQQPNYNISLKVNADGCTADTTISMLSNIIHQPPVANFKTIPSSGEVCLNTPVEFIDNSPRQFVKSIWYLGDGTIDTAVSFNYTYQNATTYWSSHAVIDSNGCISTNVDQLQIIVDAYPVVDAGYNQYVLLGDSIVLKPIVSGDSLSFIWTPSSFLNNPLILNPVCTPVNDNTYTLSVTGKNGCTSSSNVTVFVLNPIGIPNTFSPNGDGIHDTWSITSISKYPDVTVKVFNRYGQLLYNSIGYTNPWDGKCNGKPLPFGTYYYLINPGNGASVISGWVTIIR